MPEASRGGKTKKRDIEQPEEVIHVVDLTGLEDKSEPKSKRPRKRGKDRASSEIEGAGRDGEDEETKLLRASPYRPDIVIAFHLVNAKEFAVRVAASNSKPIPLHLLHTFQFVPNVRFDMAKSRWMVPLTYHDQLQATLEKRHGVCIEPLPKATLLAVGVDRLRDVIQGSNLAPGDAESCNEELQGRVPEQLLKALAPFQRLAVRFVLRNEGRALIADEMGLGKTRSSVACAVAYQEDWPVLIVCPSSARHHWQAEILSLLVPSIVHTRDVVVVESAAQPLEIIGHRRSRASKFVIISYTLAQKMAAKLEQLNFNVVICDECHYLKNSKARRTKALVPMIKASRRAIMVSGTPALSRPMELFTQLNALAPLSWPDEKEFGKRYCRVERRAAQSKGAGTAGGLPGSYSSSSSSGAGGAFGASASGAGGEFKGASNTKELHVMLTGTLMIRRLKKDILVHLPPKERQIVRVEVGDPSKRKELRTLLSRIRAHEETVRQAQAQAQAVAQAAKAAGASKSGSAKRSRTQAGSASAAANAAEENSGAITAVAAAPVTISAPGESTTTQSAASSGNAAAGGASAGTSVAVERLNERKSLLLQLFTKSGEAKLSAVLQHIGRHLDGMQNARANANAEDTGAGGKILIFAHHRSVMDGIARFLDQRRLDFIRIDGQTNGRERHGRVAHFQSDPSCRVALLAITAAGIAITLTAANHVFFAEMFWTPGSLIQAEDRAHRIGQTSNVTVTYFLAPGTVDEVLWPLIRRKMRTLGEVVEGSVGSDFSFEEVMANTNTAAVPVTSAANSGAGGAGTAGDAGGGLEVSGLEALATEMAVESVLLTRAEAKSKTGGAGGGGGGGGGKDGGDEEEEDEDVRDVLGIDAVPPEEGDEDGEWPDALAQLYLSRLQRHPAVVELTDLVDGPEGPKLVEQQESSRKVIGKWLGLPPPLLPALPGAAEGEMADEGAENLRTVRKQQRRQELLTILQLRRSEDLRQRSRQSAAGF